MISMDLFTVQAQICKSSKDITLFADILDKMDIDGNTRISNISKFSKDHNVSRRKTTDILNRMCSTEPELLIKIDTGVYRINPYLYMGKKIRSNEIREQLQNDTDLLKDETFNNNPSN